MNLLIFVSALTFLLSSSCLGMDAQKSKAEEGISKDRELKGAWKPSVNKCCPKGQALFHGKGCVKAQTPPSRYLSEQLKRMGVRYGLPVPQETKCEMIVWKRNVEARWSISETGKLAVDAPQGELAIQNYCIDDLLDIIKKTASPTAVTCRHENNGKLQVPLPLSAFRQKTVGKCCARHNYMSKNSSKCEHSSKVLARAWELPVPGVDNDTQLGYTGFPKCPDSYSVQVFDTERDEYVRIEKDLSLVHVKMDGQCVENETSLDRTEYCFDYSRGADGTTKPLAIVCRLPAPPPLSTPRAPLLAGLLSVSTSKCKH